MIINVYCIKDSRTGYLTPTFEANDEVAYRNFAHAVLTSGSILTSHKQDFRLFRIGEFDSDTASFVSCVPELVVDGGDISAQN